MGWPPLCRGLRQDGRGPQPQRVREHSIEAKADWEELDEIALSRLGDLQFEPPEPEDLYVAHRPVAPPSPLPM
jgi:hypothetical protein